MLFLAQPPIHDIRLALSATASRFEIFAYIKCTLALLRAPNRYWLIIAILKSIIILTRIIYIQILYLMITSVEIENEGVGLAIKFVIIMPGFCGKSTKYSIIGVFY